MAKADPACPSLDGPLLLIFHGPHGYVSASWYADDRIPTWNHVTLHVRGTPERLHDALAVLRRTVDALRVGRRAARGRWSGWARPRARWPTRSSPFACARNSWHAEAKLSQDKPAAERARVLAGLDAPGPYANAPLAEAMRRHGA